MGSKCINIGSSTTTSYPVVVSPSSHDFEPYCEWQREDARDLLIVHVPDFKKNELRVQVNNLGGLKITGDKLADPKGNIRRRFYKESRLPSGCEINEIQARLSNGKLTITMPKKKNSTTTSIKDNAHAQQQLLLQYAADDDHHKKPKEPTTAIGSSSVQPKSAAGAVENRHKEPAGDHSAENVLEKMMGRVFPSTSDESAEIMVGFGRFKVRKKVALSFGLALVATAAVGALAVYGFTTATSSPPPSSSSTTIDPKTTTPSASSNYSTANGED